MFNSTLIKTVSLLSLRPNPFQPRKNFDPESLLKLSDSIRANGFLQPILVRPLAHDEKCFEIIAGERRFRAAELAKITDVPVVVRQASDQEMAVWAITENTEREELNPVEIARAYDLLSREFHLTQKEIASIQGVHEKSVAHYLRLLKLDSEVIALIEQSKLQFAHARLLVSKPLSVQRKIGGLAAKQGWSLRQLERQLAVLDQMPKNGSEKIKDPDIISLEDRLSAIVGLAAKITYDKQGTGRISFDFTSLEELQGLLDRLLPSSGVDDDPLRLDEW